MRVVLQREIQGLLSTGYDSERVQQVRLTINSHAISLF